MPPLHILFLGAAWGKWAADALLDGLQSARPDAVVLDVSQSKECPAIPPAPCIAVCFGLRPPHEDWVKVFSAAGLHTLVLDNGYLGRVPYDVEPEGDGRDTYFYALNVDRILDPLRTKGILAITYPNSFDAGRVARFEHLLRPPREFFAISPPKYVMLGQTPEDRSHNKPESWLTAFYVARLTLCHDTGLETYFRPHPHAPGDMTKAVSENCPKATILPCDVPLVPQLDQLSTDRHRVTVYSYCSNAGLEATLAGFHTLSESGWYWGLGPREALEAAVHAQFTLPELRSPELAGRLLDALTFTPESCKG